MLARALPAAFAFTLAAQTPGVPVSGIVRNASSQIPIPGVHIKIDDGGTRFDTTTDAAGRFRFAAVPPSSYDVRLEKEGYRYQPDFLTFTEGALRVAAQPLEVAYRMDQYSALSGRVLDPSDNPVAGVLISTWPPLESMGSSRGAQGITTDAQGRYELDRVLPGSYYVSVRSPQAQIFYPSTANPAEAERVTVAGGAPRTGVDIRLVEPVLATLTGRVTGPDGAPLEGIKIRLQPAIASSGGAPSGASFTPAGFVPPTFRAAATAGPPADAPEAISEPDGAFRIANILPGAWQLIARYEAAAPGLFATQRVDVAAPTAGQPDTPVEVQLLARFNTVLRYDWSGPPPPAPFGVIPAFDPPPGARPPGTQPRPAPRPPPGATAALPVPLPATPAPTTATLENVDPGTYSISPLAMSAPAPAGYYLARVLQGGADLQGQPVQLTPTAPPLTLLFKPNAAEVTGTIDGDTPAIAILWSANPEREPYIRATAVQAASGFRLANLPPGTYHLAAFDRIPFAGLTVPLLNTLARTATSVTLREGATANLKLKPGQWPE